jgi:hypothetical protein
MTAPQRPPPELTVGQLSARSGVAGPGPRNL